MGLHRNADRRIYISRFRTQNPHQLKTHRRPHEQIENSNDPDGKRGTPKRCVSRKNTDSLHARHMSESYGVANIRGRRVSYHRTVVRPRIRMGRNSTIPEICVICTTHTGTILSSPRAGITIHRPLSTVVFDHTFRPNPSPHTDTLHLQYNSTAFHPIGRQILGR